MSRTEQSRWTTVPRGIALLIKDDGRRDERSGLWRDPLDHLGLISMRERGELAGGWCRVEVPTSRGTSMEAWVPGPVEASAAA